MKPILLIETEVRCSIYQYIRSRVQFHHDMFPSFSRNICNKNLKIFSRILGPINSVLTKGKCINKLLSPSVSGDGACQAPAIASLQWDWFWRLVSSHATPRHGDHVTVADWSVFAIAITCSHRTRFSAVFRIICKLLSHFMSFICH